LAPVDCCILLVNFDGFARPIQTEHSIAYLTIQLSRVVSCRKDVYTTPSKLQDFVTTAEDRSRRRIIAYFARIEGVVTFGEGLAPSFGMMFGRPLIVVNLAIVFVASLAVTTSTTVTTCDPRFDDVPSRTLTSGIVFQGSVTRSRRRGTSNTTLSVVQLRVTRVWKGGVSSSQTVTVVGECSLDAEVGATYVVFAVAARDSWSDLDDGELYGVLGRPVRSSRRVMRQVDDYVQTQGERTLAPSSLL